MNAWNVARKLGPVDLKNVRRDSLLAWVIGIPLVMILVIRIALPPLTQVLYQQFTFDLEPVYPLIMGGFVLMIPGIVGMIIGFLLLDERDERTLMVLLVTPVPLSGYLLYRISLPVLIGVIVTILCYPLAGLVPISLVGLLLVAFLGSLAAPQFALFLAAFAENKVAGFSMMKLLNILVMIPLVAIFLPEPWQWATGILPTYWPLKVFWLAVAGQDYAVVLACGLLVNLLCILILLKRFMVMAHR